MATVVRDYNQGTTTYIYRRRYVKKNGDVTYHTDRHVKKTKNKPRTIAIRKSKIRKLNSIKKEIISKIDYISDNQLDILREFFITMTQTGVSVKD